MKNQKRFICLVYVRFYSHNVFLGDGHGIEGKIISNYINDALPLIVK